MVHLEILVLVGPGAPLPSQHLQTYSASAKNQSCLHNFKFNTNSGEEKNKQIPTACRCRLVAAAVYTWHHMIERIMKGLGDPGDCHEPFDILERCYCYRSVKTIWKLLGSLSANVRNRLRGRPSRCKSFKSFPPRSRVIGMKIVGSKKYDLGMVLGVFNMASGVSGCSSMGIRVLLWQKRMRGNFLEDSSGLAINVMHSP